MAGPGVPSQRRGPLVALEASTLLSAMGNGITSVALPWLVLERTGSPATAGAVAAAAALPQLLASLVVGTLVDRVGRVRTAVAADVSSALSVVAIPLVDATVGLTVPVLLALAVLGAAFDPAGFTARETLLPAAAAAAGWRLERVNGVHEAVFGLAFLVGPGLGGVLVATVGAASTLWAAAVAFVIAVLLVAAVRVPGAGRPVRRPTGLWSDAAEGLAFVWRDRLLRTIALLTMGLVALYLPVEGVVLPAYFVAEDAPERLGIVVMAMSGGGVVGALAFGVGGHRVRRRPAFVVSLIGSCAALLAMAALPPYPALVVLGALVGLLYGPINPLANYAMQTRTPERLRGRVVGVMTSSAYAAGPVGYLVAGLLVERFGVRPAFLAMAGACWLSRWHRCRCGRCGNSMRQPDVLTGLSRGADRCPHARGRRSHPRSRARSTSRTPSKARREDGGRPGPAPIRCRSNRDRYRPDNNDDDGRAGGRIPPSSVRHRYPVLRPTPICRQASTVPIPGRATTSTAPPAPRSACDPSEPSRHPSNRGCYYDYWNPRSAIMTQAFRASLPPADRSHSSKPLPGWLPYGVSDERAEAMGLSSMDEVDDVTSVGHGVVAELVAWADDWARAIAGNDLEQIGGVMADEWVIVSESGISTKEEFLSAVRSGALTHSAMDRITPARVRVYGDTAILTARVTNTAHYGGERYDADEWTTDVFVLRNGRWQCVLSQITPAAAG